MGTATVEHFVTHDLEVRRTEYRHWCEAVRDPANTSTEGIRKIKADNGSAVAQYEVAQLPSGEWAVRVCFEYRCGNYSGMGTPWTEFPSRDHCIAYFLTTARRHFGHNVHPTKSPKQKSAQISIAGQLADGLFGFIEPTSSPRKIRRSATKS
jgi:hypothetical protein